MPNFKYEGRDTNGNLITGERFADSPDNLSGLLLKEGVTPIQITQHEERIGLFQKLVSLFEKKHVSNTELALFTRQMYTLNKAGVPISTAMKHLAKTSRSRRMSDVLMGISQKLESGQNLALSMEQYPDVFSPLIIAMVQIGQTTGQLDNAFMRLTEYLELEGGTIKRVKTAIRYPVFVMIAIFVGIVIMNIFVIPAFAKVYMRANIPLPLMTRILIDISNFFAKYWLFLLALVVIIGIAIHRYLTSPNGKYQWHKYQLKIPIIGHLVKRMVLLRFSQTFTIVVDSGIPINEGLALVAESITNVYARREIYAMKDAIQRGSSIFQAASACKLFTSLELQMLSISEQTGELGAMLNEIALYYQREVEYDLKRLTDIIEPVLLGGVALMVLFLALAVYMPIWSMVKLVHKG